jgi:hypothetical protein
MNQVDKKKEELDELVKQGKVAPPPEPAPPPAKWRAVRNEVTGCWRIER